MCKSPHQISLIPHQISPTQHRLNSTPHREGLSPKQFIYHHMELVYRFIKLFFLHIELAQIIENGIICFCIRLIYHHNKLVSQVIIMQRWVNAFCTNTTGNYLFKVNNRNTRTKCEISSKLAIKTAERRDWCPYCWLLTYFTPCSSVSFVNFE